jgi:aryl-alcohol dehydrogenase-like predicted oxidoreductase
MKRLLADDVLEAVERLRPLAADLGMSMAQLSLAWVLHNDAVSAAIIGATRPEQVADNVAASGVHLDDTTLAAIDEALAPVIARDPALTRSPKARP